MLCGNHEIQGTNSYNCPSRDGLFANTGLCFRDQVSLGADVEVESIAYGWRHACAIVSGGQVKCWGDNRSGQLGQGHIDTIGDDEGEMGDDLPFVDLGDTDAQAVWMTLGESHSCAMLSSSDVK